MAYADDRPDMSRSARNQSRVRRRSTGWVVGRPRPFGLMIVCTRLIWSTENRIIGSGGENVDSHEHCVTNALRYSMNSLPEQTEALAHLRKELRETLLRLHGPLLGGEPLAAALGHRGVASLRQARRRGQVMVPLFTVPNRRGWFALTLDVADWLSATRMGASAGGRISPS